jgi:hypothetical protein
MTNTELEQRAQEDMEEFERQDPMPDDIDSPEFYAWNRRRVERARAFIDSEMARAELELAASIEVSPAFCQKRWRQQED